MGIKNPATDLLERGKAAFDANKDGKVEAGEVAGVVSGRAKEIADAAGAAAKGIKQSIDTNQDGKVDAAEVKAAAEGAAKKASAAASGAAKKASAAASGVVGKFKTK